MRTSNERGIALITTLLIMMLISALLVGFTIVISSDQRFRFIDRDRQQAFYAASAGLEKLTADLGDLFMTNLAPTTTQVSALGQPTGTPPAIPGITFTKQDATPGYTISQVWAGTTNISTGPYAGLMALMKRYQVDVTARTIGTGGEVHLQRTTETVAIPVFQFGMFSDMDLAFFAGSDFGFGGRVHTNGNLFLSQGGGTLTLSDKVTAVKDIVRQYLQNGGSIDANPTHTATVSMAQGTGGPFRDLDRTEGSVVDGLGPAPVYAVNPSWYNLSLTTYNAYIRNGATGAKKLILPLVTAGGTNPDLIRRPAAANENTANVLLYNERDYTKASLRILLSDTAAQITNLPGIAAGSTPLSLEAGQTGTWPGYAIDATSHPPIAASASTVTVLPILVGTNLITVDAVAPNSTLNFPVPGRLWLNGTAITYTGKTATTFTGANQVGCGGCGLPASAAGSTVTMAATPALSPNNTGLIGGFILIEKQDVNGVWTDVTPEILKLGITAQNQAGNVACTPNTDSVIQLQRRAVQTGAGVLGCPGGAGTQSIAPGDYWSQSLFDAREAMVRDNINPAGPLFGGVMYYVSLDANNLKRWFAGTIPAAGATGTVAHNSNGAGYSVYFSDRRNNNNLQTGLGVETGEYGNEDIINPASPAGTANVVLDAGAGCAIAVAAPWTPCGEDVNGNGQLDTYGQFPHNPANNFAGWTAPLTSATLPSTPVSAIQAQSNRAILFRRALLLENGNLITPLAGLTIISENPVYVEGDWNANSAGGGFNDPHAATSVLADAVTLLSNNWNDDTSFANPYNSGARQRPADNYYRIAIVGGKNPAFLLPAFAGAADFGTDGGAHNFLRMLESNPGGGSTVHYLGSIATFFFSRQATGVYKSSSSVYGVPTRDFVFDIDFLDPAKLPPLTPVFRDLNTIGFFQELRPGK
jgi:Tfp pilus assembly protein PilX